MMHVWKATGDPCLPSRKYRVVQSRDAEIAYRRNYRFSDRSDYRASTIVTRFADHGERHEGSIMLKLKGKDATIMVIPSDGSRGEGEGGKNLSRIFMRSFSFILRRGAGCSAKREKTPCCHPHPLLFPLIPSKRTNACLPLHFKISRDPFCNSSASHDILTDTFGKKKNLKSVPTHTQHHSAFNIISVKL